MNTYQITFRYYETLVQATDSDHAVWQAAEVSDLSDEDRGELMSVIILSDDGKTGDEILIGEDGKARNSEISQAVAREKGFDLPAVRVIGQEAAQRQHDAEVANALDGPLPPRRAHGLTLVRWYCEIEKKWQFDVQRFGYGASLTFADNEGELYDSNDSYMKLNHRDMKIIDGWVQNEARYIAQAEKETGLIDTYTS